MTRQRHSKAPAKKSSPAIASPSFQQTPDFSQESQSVEKPHNPNFSGLSNELSFPVQAKLTIGEPNDKYEKEADRVADQVVKQIHAPDISKSEDEQIQCKAETNKQLPSITPLNFSNLQRKGDRQTSDHAAGLETSINQAQGTGQKLPNFLKPRMEKAFGQDFSNVRIHENAVADRLNHSIRAKAFTTGRDIFFRKGEYQPTSRTGQTLLAHELTHIVQQKGQPSRVQKKGDSIKKAVTQGRNDEEELNYLETIITTVKNKLEEKRVAINSIKNSRLARHYRKILNSITERVGRDTKHWGDKKGKMTLGQALNNWSKEWGIAKTGGLLADLGLAYKGAGRQLESIKEVVESEDDSTESQEVVHSDTSLFDIDMVKSVMPRGKYLASGRSKKKGFMGKPSYASKSKWSTDLPKGTKKNAGPSATTANVIGMLHAHGIDSATMEAAMYALQQFWEAKSKKLFEYAYHTSAEVWAPYNQYLRPDMRPVKKDE